MASERSSYKDRISGVEVTQHNNYRGHSHHFYFTNNGWYDGGKKLDFASDRNNRSNLYGLDIASGEIEQLTDLEPVGLPRELEFVRASLNQTNDEIYFFHDLNLMALDPHPRISPDGGYVVFTSDRSGYGNIYSVPLVEYESLPLVEE